MNELRNLQKLDVFLQKAFNGYFIGGIEFNAQFLDKSLVCQIQTGEKLFVRFINICRLKIRFDTFCSVYKN